MPTSPSHHSADTLVTVVAELRRAGCVFAEDEVLLLASTAKTASELETMVARRCQGEPIEHVVGWATFYGATIAVEPGVFVPRRRSELLARIAIEEAGSRRTPVVVDLCCGSGAIAVAVRAALPSVELYATDIDPIATGCARRNLGREALVIEGDLFDALPPVLRGRIDVAVANAPYVPTDAIGTLPTEARLHEATIALDGGVDGLDVHRRLAEHAGEWLAPGGCLLVEVADAQASRAIEIFGRSGLGPRCLVSPDLDATVVVGTVTGDVTGAPASRSGSGTGSRRMQRRHEQRG